MNSKFAFPQLLEIFGEKKGGFWHFLQGKTLFKKYICR
jgi:hypothetical protein